MKTIPHPPLLYGSDTKKEFDSIRKLLGRSWMLLDVEDVASISGFYSIKWHACILNRSNYLLWKSQVIPPVRGHGVAGYLLGTKLCPAEFLERHDEQAEVWSTLEHLFTTRSQAKLLQLKMELQNLKKGNLSMADYLAKLENLADQCAIAGYLIEDEDLVMHALAGLDSEYDSIVCIITTRHTDEKLALKEVYSLLLNQEARIQQHHAAMVINNPSANYSAKNGGQYGTRSRGHGNYFSRGRGRGRNGNSGHSNGSSGKPICQICGKQGHIALNYWYRMDETFQASSSSSNGGVKVMLQLT
ncbi:Copia-like polyprotein/retrotransposon [Trema orientale]|uniref:Copia-like polyprotein/retrotransposon n=1 Tax=Trema orientale TaxID=63057 RepID=A0A2P5EC84_TREOI|nr:Copia-like polyprotein/retrotransposon [Trema orientale]